MAAPDLSPDNSKIIGNILTGAGIAISIIWNLYNSHSTRKLARDIRSADLQIKHFDSLYGGDLDRSIQLYSNVIQAFEASVISSDLNAISNAAVTTEADFHSACQIVERVFRQIDSEIRSGNDSLYDVVEKANVELASEISAIKSKQSMTISEINVTQKKVCALLTRHIDSIKRKKIEFITQIVDGKSPFRN